MFADYEAYLACQAQVDQLYQVRSQTPELVGAALVGEPQGTSASCCLGCSWEVTVQLVAQSRHPLLRYHLPLRGVLAIPLLSSATLEPFDSLGSGCHPPGTFSLQRRWRWAVP